MATDPNAYDGLFEAAGKANNVDPRLLKTVFMLESGGNAATKDSIQGAQGGMQMLQATAASLGAKDPRDMAQAVPAAAAYIRQGLDATGSPEGALAYYHGGPNQNNWGPKTQAYVAKGQATYPGITLSQPGQTLAERYPGSYQIASSDNSIPPPPSKTNAEDPDVAAGRALFEQLTGKNAGNPQQSDSKAPAAPADPNVEAGKQLFEAITGSKVGAPVVEPQEPSVIEKIGAGMSRGLHDVVDTPAELLARLSDKAGLTPWLQAHGANAPDAVATSAADKAGLDAYNQKYGDSAIAGGVRMGTQLAATIPILASGGELVGAGADLASAGATRFLAPGIGDAIATGQKILSGTAGNNLFARAGSLAAQGALQGGAAGAITSGQSSDPILDQMQAGAISGAVLGPVAHAAGSVIGKGVGVVTGSGTGVPGKSGVSQPIAELAQLARNKYNIPISAPQMSSNSVVRLVNDQSSKLPFSGAKALADRQQEAFNVGVANSFGGVDQGGNPAKLITSGVMDDAATRISQMFKDVAARTRVISSPKLWGDLGRIQTNAAATPLGASGENDINKLIDLVNNSFKTAPLGPNVGPATTKILSGADYQALTRTDAPLDRAMKSADPNVSYYAGQIRNAIDDAFQRSASSSDQALLSKARSQWRAMKTIEPLVAASTDGNIPPAQLMAKVNSVSRQFDGSTSGTAFKAGGDLGDLARIGQAFLKSPPNSGTADRAMTNLLMLGGAGGIGYLSPGALLASAALPALAVGAGRYARSAGYANRLLNASLNQTPAVTRGLSPVTGAVLPVVGNALGTGYRYLTQ